MVAGDFRKGVTFEMDGKVFMVVDFQHVKPGKGAAFVRTKLKNVVTGQVIEQTFNPTDKYPDARIERKEMQYSYNADGIYYFMDMETFDMLPLNYDIVEEAMQFVKEEMMVTIQLYKGEAFSVVAPNF
ncbi:MAG: elongation factor P, partial [Clostridia bacterium]|nr:elongation factor P [Clostridia bacterium]